jgi:hypothetical protein
LTRDGEEASLAELIIGYFQANLWRIGSIGGVGGTTRRVVSFIASSEFEDFRRGAEKIARKSGSEKIAAG